MTRIREEDLRRFILMASCRTGTEIVSRIQKVWPFDCCCSHQSVSSPSLCLSGLTRHASLQQRFFPKYVDLSSLKYAENVRNMLWSHVRYKLACLIYRKLYWSVGFPQWTNIKTSTLSNSCLVTMWNMWNSFVLILVKITVRRHDVVYVQRI